MKIKNEIVKTIVTAGLIGGFLSLLLLIILFALGHNPYGKLSIFGLWIPVVIIVFGIKYIKDKYNGFEIGFAEGWLYGILIGFVFAVSSAIFVLNFHIAGGSEAIKLHQTELVDLIIKNKANYTETMKLSEEAYQKLIEDNRNVSIGSIALDDFIKKFTGCIIVAIISAVIMRKHIPKEEIIK